VVLASSFLYIHGQLRLSYRLLHWVSVSDTVLGNCSFCAAIVLTFFMSLTWSLPHLAILWQQPSLRHTILLLPKPLVILEPLGSCIVWVPGLRLMIFSGVCKIRKSIQKQSFMYFTISC
jgi:hypothetical protein